MADRPEDRPESASDLVSDLRAGLESVLAPDAPAPDPPGPDAPEPDAPEPDAPAVDAPGVDPPAPPAVRGAPPPPARGRRAGALIAALGALAVIAVIVVLALRGQDEGPTPSTEGQSAEPPAAASPETVVRGFYTDAANDRFEEAWKLAGPRARAQLGGFAAFRRQLSTLRSVDFRENRTVSESDTRASVAIQTRAVHTNRVDNCQGDVTLTRNNGRWLIDRLGVNCA
jgi:hypothetical protein